MYGIYTMVTKYFLKFKYPTKEKQKKFSKAAFELSEDMYYFLEKIGKRFTEETIPEQEMINAEEEFLWSQHESKKLEDEVVPDVDLTVEDMERIITGVFDYDEFQEIGCLESSNWILKKVKKDTFTKSMKNIYLFYPLRAFNYLLEHFSRSEAYWIHNSAFENGVKKFIKEFKKPPMGPKFFETRSMRMVYEL